MITPKFQREYPHCARLVSRVGDFFFALLGVTAAAAACRYFDAGLFTTGWVTSAIFHLMLFGEQK